MDTAPRLLTDAEIEEVLNRALPAPGKPRTGSQAAVIAIADPAVAKTAYQNTRRLLRQQLKRERIAPAAIDALVELIARRLTQAQVPAGDNVGGKCGEAMAGPVTQMTLNTFHQAGSGKDVGGGIDGLRALLNMNETRYPQVFIHFKDKTLSERSIVDMRKDYVALPMITFLKDYDIGLSETEGTLRMPEEYDADLWWVRAYQELHPELLVEVSPWYLRVELNTALMVEYAVTPEHIRRTLETNVIKVVPSPMRLGVVYLFVQVDSIPKSFKEDKPEGEGDVVDIVILYLQSVVVPSFQDIAFRGIPGVTRMLPARSKTTKIVTEEVPVYGYDQIAAAPEDERDRMRRTWRVLLHAGRIKTSGVTASYLADLFRRGGFQADVQDALTLVVVVPAGAQGLPSVLINTLVAEEQKATEALRTQALVESKERNQRIQTVQDGPLVRASQYTFGHAFGSGFLRALVHPDVDPYFTYSNEISTTYELFGIEAARNLWVLMFTQAMEQAGDTSTDARHLILAADILFNQGRPLGITYRGISRQKGSTLAMITVEKAMEGISKVAAVGGLDNTTAASAAIMVGRRGEWGTGYALDILPDPETEKKHLDALRASKAVIPVEELQAALDEVEDTPLTEEDLFRQATAAPLLPPKAAPKAPTLATAPLPPSVQQLLRPAPVVSPALLDASTHVAAAPSLPQGVEALVVVTKQARRVLPRFVPPQVALVLADTSGSTSAPWDAGMPVPDFVPLTMAYPGAPVQSIKLLASAPTPLPAPDRLRSGLPAPIDARAWILFSRGN